MSGDAWTLPATVLTPRSVEEVSAAVRQAAEQGRTLRAVGTGHSFTPLVATDGVLLRPEGLTGLLRFGAGTATVAAGSMLHDVNVALHAQGLALANMGDITEQTVAGAIATGTHGTGRDSASLSAQVAGLLRTALVRATGCRSRSTSYPRSSCRPSRSSARSTTSSRASPTSLQPTTTSSSTGSRTRTAR